MLVFCSSFFTRCNSSFCAKNGAFVRFSCEWGGRRHKRVFVVVIARSSTQATVLVASTAAHSISLSLSLSLSLSCSSFKMNLLR